MADDVALRLASERLARQLRDLLAGTLDIDAAIFEIENPDGVSSSQDRHYGTPSVVRPTSRGMQLQKVDRTTGHTKGRVKEDLAGEVTFDHAFKVPIGPDTVKSFQGVCAFVDAWSIDLLGSKFALNGDSGSLVYTLWSKPSDFPSDPIQREESCYDLTLWKMSRSRSVGSFSRG